jgi:subtilase family serine protease
MVPSPPQGGMIQATLTQSTQATFPIGSTVTITAFPNEGWMFDSWSGDATGNSSTISMQLNSNRIVIASFIKAPSMLEIYQPYILVGIFAIVIVVAIAIVARRR